jgi:hypothetical protein
VEQPQRAAEDWRVTALDYTRYDDRNRAIHHPVPDPTWEQIREAIQSLDGGRQSDLSIEAANGNVMCVGGGQGRYVVETQTGRHSRTGVAATLVNPAGGDAVEGGVVIGGCQTELAERYVVDLGSALRAAERFYRDGQLEPSLEWEPY